jgi:hypothetical protein
MDHRTVEYNFESGPTKDPLNSIWFHLDQWFLSIFYQNKPNLHHRQILAARNISQKNLGDMLKNSL